MDNESGKLRVVYSMTPLILSTTGGVGRETTTFYKHFADIIAQKRQHP